MEEEEGRQAGHEAGHGTLLNDARVSGPARRMPHRHAPAQSGGAPPAPVGDGPHRRGTREDEPRVQPTTTTTTKRPHALLTNRRVPTSARTAPWFMRWALVLAPGTVLILLMGGKPYPPPHPIPTSHSPLLMCPLPLPSFLSSTALCADLYASPPNLIPRFILFFVRSAYDGTRLWMAGLAGLLLTYTSDLLGSSAGYGTSQ